MQLATEISELLLKDENHDCADQWEQIGKIADKNAKKPEVQGISSHD